MVRPFLCSARQRVRSTRPERYPAELLARLGRDQALATRRAMSAVDRVFANAGARALSFDNRIQRAGRDIHAGTSHAGNVAESKLSACGALAFGTRPGAY
jgi:3-hydroxy-9,10-secoandrosta-1,3,5(10)-triene-9,17-dione monooxygenase